MCKENQSRDEECHKVGPSENSKVRDNPKLLPSQLFESKRSSGVNEGQGKAFRKLKTVLLSAHGPTAPDVKMGYQRAKEPYDCADAVILQNRTRGGHHKKGRYPVR